MTRNVDLQHVTIRFGSNIAVDDADLSIAGGEFFSFLGPSGCGKTTLLRCISGFIEPSKGKVLIGGRDMRRIGPNRRPTALIFQNLALFPLMTVAENIAFPLEVRGVSRRERRRRADELLDLIALPGMGDKKVQELSGGQRQRVAIARALAVEPDILLLDEPLSALDLKLRQHMRTELRAIQKKVGLTFIYITHDQGEALTMSDRVAVMSNGVIEQIDVPAAIYDQPRTSFVASFVGETNTFEGKVAAQDSGIVALDLRTGRRIFGQAGGERQFKTGEACMIFVRPEQLRIADADSYNRLPARVLDMEFEGSTRHLLLEAEEARLRLTLMNEGNAFQIKPGDRLELTFDPLMAPVLPAGPLARA